MCGWRFSIYIKRRCFVKYCSIIFLISIFVLTNQLIVVYLSIMIKLKKISLSRLHKLETKGLVLDVIRILEYHNIESLRLDDFHTLLLEQKAKMKHLSPPHGKHILTHELARLHRKRLKIASYIALQISEMEKMDWEEKQKMAKVAKRFSDKFLTYLGRKSRVEVTITISLFFTSIRNKEHSEAYEALMGMGLKANLDDLEKANKEFDKLHTERDSDIKKRPKTGDIYIEREAHNLLRHFFWKIDLYQNTYKEVDYSDLISQLNVELTRCSKIIKTRIATNKRRARKKATAAAKLKAEASKAKDKPKIESDSPKTKDAKKIEPESKSDDEPKANANIKLNKSLRVNPLSAHSSQNTADRTEKDKKKEDAKDESDKKDSKSKGDTNGKGNE